MFTKIANLFSVMIFSTTNVANELPIKIFHRDNYPYGVVEKEHLLMDILNDDLFEKPVYFLWDVSSFLQRGDLGISVNSDVNFLNFNIFGFPDCKKFNSSNPASKPNSVSTLKVDTDIIKKLSDGFRLAYKFNDNILTLGGNNNYSFTFNALLDYYKQNSFFNKVNFLLRYLVSFMDYNCFSGVSLEADSKSLNNTMFLVPKWNNLSGINLRYFYLSEYHTLMLDRERSLGISLLSVDLKNRYVKNKLLIYPVVTASPYINVNLGKVNSYYRSNYLNLFTSGFISSFSYNTIIIEVPLITKLKSASSGLGIRANNIIFRFMNFSMLDATTVTGGNSEGNPKGGGLFDEVSSTSCTWYDLFCHLTTAVKWVMNNIVGFQQLYRLVNLFFTPMTLTLKTFKQYNIGLGDLPLVSPVIVSGAMLLVLFNFYRRFK